MVEKKQEEKKELTPEAAKNLLLKDQQEKQSKCQAEIQAVLDKYNMKLAGYATIPVNQVSIVPNA